MRFSYPRFPAEFEIPDDWWAVAGMLDFKPADTSFRWQGDAATLVPIFDVEPPSRGKTCPLDFHGFGKDRLIRILRWIADGAEIEPVPLRRLPTVETFRIPYDYQTCEGFHRYHASVAAGFVLLPAIIH